MTHGKSCVTRHVKENAYVTHGKANACVTHDKPCVHMHVNGEVYKRGGKLVCKEGEQQGKEGKKKKKKEEKKRDKEGEGGGGGGGGWRKLAFRQSELIRPRSKIRIFEEGYTPRGRDSSYFGLFFTIRVVGLCLYPKELFGRILKYRNLALF